MQLVKYVPIGDVGKLRSSYLAAKIDPSVFVHDDGMMTPVQPQEEEISPTFLPTSNDPDEEMIDNTSTEEKNGHTTQGPEAGSQPQQQSKIDHVCSWRPHDLLSQYKESRHTVQSQQAYFRHITNFVARAEAMSDANLVPSPYLDVHIKDDQMKLLKPTQKDVVMGCILQDTMGPGAVKLIAKRRIDALDGNVGSYSRLLNSSARLQQIKEVNALAAAVAEITRDKEDARKRKKEATANLALKKADKKQAAESTDETRRLEAVGYLMPLMEKFKTGERTVSSLDALSGKVLKEIIKFYYNVKLKGIATMKKVDLIDEVAKRLVVCQHAVPAGSNVVGGGEAGHL